MLNLIFGCCNCSRTEEYGSNSLINNNDDEIDENLIDEESLIRTFGDNSLKNTNLKVKDELFIARITNLLQEEEDTGGVNNSNILKTLEILPSIQCQQVVIEGVWNLIRHNWRKRNLSKLQELFKQSINEFLTKESQIELKNILNDLPPATMGDKEGS